MPSFHTVSLTHQGLVANTELHLLMLGEQSHGKAGLHVLLFRAPNRMSAAKEEIEIEMTKKPTDVWRTRRLVQELPKKENIPGKISG